MLQKSLFLLAIIFCTLVQVKGQQLLTEKISYVAPSNPNYENAYDSVTGSPLLLKKWVKGVVVNMNDSVINDTGLRMNFNKINGQLVVTRDKQNYLHTEKRDIKGFILYTDSGRLIFTKVPEINARDFFQLLAMGNNCTLYKRVNTSAKGYITYRNNGSPDYTERAERYEDFNAYYLMEDVNGKDRLQGKFYATKNSIKSAFKFNNDKLQQYFTQKTGAVINDDFIIGLAAYFNKQ